MKITRENIERLIAAAVDGRPELTPEVLSVKGYSSSRVRRLLNALNSNVEAANYLEIGVHLGSTFIPALYGNKAHATCIDNWSLFGNCRPEFEANLRTHLGRTWPKRVGIIEGDCFKVSPVVMPRDVNVYFFDGDHSYPSQYNAFKLIHPYLANRFVALVDDWNWQEPRDGTRHSLRDLNFVIEAEWELQGDYNGSENGWWNGLWVGIVSKP